MILETVLTGPHQSPGLVRIEVVRQGRIDESDEFQSCAGAVGQRISDRVVPLVSPELLTEGGAISSDSTPSWAPARRTTSAALISSLKRPWITIENVPPSWNSASGLEGEDASLPRYPSRRTPTLPSNRSEDMSCASPLTSTSERAKRDEPAWTRIRGCGDIGGVEREGEHRVMLGVDPGGRRNDVSRLDTLYTLQCGHPNSHSSAHILKCAPVQFYR